MLSKLRYFNVNFGLALQTLMTGIGNSLGYEPANDFNRIISNTKAKFGKFYKY